MTLEHDLAYLAWWRRCIELRFFRLRTEPACESRDRSIAELWHVLTELAVTIAGAEAHRRAELLRWFDG